MKFSDELKKLSADSQEAKKKAMYNINFHLYMVLKEACKSAAINGENSVTVYSADIFQYLADDLFTDDYFNYRLQEAYEKDGEIVVKNMINIVKHNSFTLDDINEINDALHYHFSEEGIELYIKIRKNEERYLAYFYLEW